MLGAYIARYGAFRQRGLIVLATVFKLAFHDAETDTDMLARILADASDTRDFLKLFLRQAERHGDILASL